MLGGRVPLKKKFLPCARMSRAAVFLKVEGGNNSVFITRVQTYQRWHEMEERVAVQGNKFSRSISWYYMQWYDMA